MGTQSRVPCVRFSAGPSAPEHGIGAHGRISVRTHPIGPKNHELFEDVTNRSTTAVQTMAPRGLSAREISPARPRRSTSTGVAFPAWMAIRFPKIERLSQERFSMVLRPDAMRAAHGCFTVSARLTVPS